MSSPASCSVIRRRWALYLFLLFLRFIGAIYSLPGYIHPDEFFQGGQELFFGCQYYDDHQRYHRQLNGEVTNREEKYSSPTQKQRSKNLGNNDYIIRNVPWEFEERHAVRSVVPPAFMTLLPLRLYSMCVNSLLITVLRGRFMETAAISSENQIRGQDSFVYSSVPSKSIPPWKSSFWLWVPEMEKLSGREILIIPRLFMAFLSVLFLDSSLWILVFCCSSSSLGKDSVVVSKPTEISQSKSLSEVSSSNIFEIIVRALRCGPPIQVLVLASSWPCLVFGIRPFTNTLEAMVLSFLLVIVIVNLRMCINIDSVALTEASGPTSDDKNKKLSNSEASDFFLTRGILLPILVGTICSIGIFVRFTLAFYAFPAVLHFLLHRRKTLWNKTSKRCICDGLWITLAFILQSAIFIYFDTRYYSSQAMINSSSFGVELQGERSFWRYIAPYNAFRYNSKSKNLVKHGLHPRITHALANMPMLFGPLALAWYASCFKFHPLEKDNTGNSYLTSRPLSLVHLRDISNVIFGSVIFAGLVILSCAPHQEPRFLLPCIVPLIMLCGHQVVGFDQIYQSAQCKQNRRPNKVLLLRIFWVVFNLIFYFFFGWLHQGGLITSLLHFSQPFMDITLGDSADDDGTGQVKAIYCTTPRTVIYYHTYMPPTFLSRRRPSRINTNLQTDICSEADTEFCTESVDSYYTSCGDMIIHDLQGRESSVLSEVLEQWLCCPLDGSTHDVTDCDTESNMPLYVVSPPVVVTSLLEQIPSDSKASTGWPKYTFKRLYNHKSHVSTEDWPAFNGSPMKYLEQLQLAVYEISCPDATKNQS